MRRSLCLIAGVGLLSAASCVSAQTYTYDELGRLKAAAPPSGSATNYCYDSADNRIAAQTGGVPNCTALVNNRAPTCTERVISTNQPNSSVSPALYTRTAANLISNCTDPDGDTLTVTTPGPYEVSIYANQTGEIPYTVSDGKGATASNAITISRY